MAELIEAARPSFSATARRIELTMGDIRGKAAGMELHDAVVSEGEPLRLADFIVTTATGRRSFAWCTEADCPDEIIPIFVDISDNTASVPTTGRPKGLHRLKVLGRVNEQRFYTPEEAWVLITGPAEAAKIKAGINVLQQDFRDNTRGELRLAMRMYLAAQSVP